MGSRSSPRPDPSDTDRPSRPWPWLFSGIDTPRLPADSAVNSYISAKAEGTVISSSSRRCSTHLHLLPSGKNCPRYAFASRVPKMPTSLSAPKTRAHEKWARSGRFRHAKQTLTNRPSITSTGMVAYQHNCLPSAQLSTFLPSVFAARPSFVGHR